MVVVTDPLDRHKKRLCVDYSQTVNQYREIGTYLIPRTDDMVDNLDNYSVFSTFDLKSAYHLIAV